MTKIYSYALLWATMAGLLFLPSFSLEAAGAKPVVRGYVYNAQTDTPEEEDNLEEEAKSNSIGTRKTSRSSQSRSPDIRHKDAAEENAAQEDDHNDVQPGIAHTPNKVDRAVPTQTTSQNQNSGQGDNSGVLSPNAPRSDFPVYHQLVYDHGDTIDEDRALLQTQGFTYLPILTSWFFFPPGHDREEVDEAVRERVRINTENRLVDGQMYVLDIEHWSTGSWETSETRAESVRKMSEIIDIIRSVRPNVILGYYSMVPGRNYWDVYENCAWSPSRHDVCMANEQSWRDANTELLPLAQKVDFIAPSIYTFYDNQQGWTNYAIANLQEAKRLAALAGGKPVYAYIWPRYHGSNNSGLAYTPIDGEFWAHQLQITAKMNVDGIIIWDVAEWLTLEDVIYTEDWYEETLNFMDRFLGQTN